MTPAGPAHAGVLAALHQAAFPPGEAWNEAAFATLLAQPGCFALLAGDSGFVLTRVAADEAEVLTLAVAPDQRRLGHARRLLAGAEALAHRHGARRMLLEVAAANHPACCLYEAAGYAQVGRRPAYYPGGGDALLLAKLLTSGGS